MALHGCCGRIIFHGGVAIESARSEACAAGHRNFIFLFLHQALHQLVASFLGFALGVSPAAAWIPITGGLDSRMLILCAAVTLWVCGVDVLYAFQVFEYDQHGGVFSV